MTAPRCACASLRCYERHCFCKCLNLRLQFPSRDCSFGMVDCPTVFSVVFSVRFLSRIISFLSCLFWHSFIQTESQWEECCSLPMLTAPRPLHLRLREFALGEAAGVRRLCCVAAWLKITRKVLHGFSYTLRMLRVYCLGGGVYNLPIPLLSGRRKGRKEDWLVLFGYLKFVCWYRASHLYILNVPSPSAACSFSALLLHCNFNSVQWWFILIWYWNLHL